MGIVYIDPGNGLSSKKEEKKKSLKRMCGIGKAM